MIIFVKVNFKNGLNVNNNGSLQNKPKKFNYLNFREGGGSKIRPKFILKSVGGVWYSSLNEFKDFVMSTSTLPLTS